jgi:hypothetical protein
LNKPPKKPEIDSCKCSSSKNVLWHSPVSSFIISLYKQYQQRGSLSKKQLQGLYDKASGIKDLAPGKLAAVEAIIKRMPTRYKSAIPENKPLYEKDEATGEMLQFILSKIHLTKEYCSSNQNSITTKRLLLLK